ncbi:MAG: hypothetical protein DRJ47_06255 [Thermoprotei archaeon]|nr:MAG: hypothetical protein DRJ47_06255 [Thermoprotei archaeon]
MTVPIDQLITTAISVAMGSIIATLIIWYISTYMLKRTLTNTIAYLRDPIKNHLTTILTDKETRDVLLRIAQHILSDEKIQSYIKGDKE